MKSVTYVPGGMAPRVARPVASSSRSSDADTISRNSDTDVECVTLDSDSDGEDEGMAAILS